MGYGDDIIATGLARGSASRGKRAAFGDGRKIIWGPWSEEIFKYNPHIARPGTERKNDIEWIAHYKGNRLYNKSGGDRWIWNYEFKPVPGELFFSQDEVEFRNQQDAGFVLIEPNVPWQKSCAPNKDWGHDKYQAVADSLIAQGERVVQFSHGTKRLNGVETINTQKSFRHALAALSRAKYSVLPEGGLHHGAAALGIPAVVLFGGFIPPQVTGYDIHVNLTGGEEACGSLKECQHCRRAMSKISVEEVLKATERLG